MDQDGRIISAPSGPIIIMLCNGVNAMQAAQHDTHKLLNLDLWCTSAYVQERIPPPVCKKQLRAVNNCLQGVTVASSFVNYRPCLLAASPNGINIGPAGIIIQPTGILIQPKGINVQPRGINFQPSVSASLQSCLLEDQAPFVKCMDV